MRFFAGTFYRIKFQTLPGLSSPHKLLPIGIRPSPMYAVFLRVSVDKRLPIKKGVN